MLTSEPARPSTDDAGQLSVMQCIETPGVVSEAQGTRVACGCCVYLLGAARHKQLGIEELRYSCPGNLPRVGLRALARRWLREAGVLSARV